jgi:nucleoside-diphosphate-sugar epimerase
MASFVSERLRLFLTGSTGFLGGHLLDALQASGDCDVRCLVRREVSPAQTVGGRVEYVRGDLTEPRTYVKALTGADVTVHLAAATGRVGPEACDKVNVGGTAALLAASRERGVRRFVFVSSIAATYPNKYASHYAQSKANAEQVVRSSGLSYEIVRPTLVLGRGSPVWEGLVALARLPVMPVFGPGRARTQPVFIDDAVAYLQAAIREPDSASRASDLGGPDVLTIEDLLRRIRRALRGGDRPVLHVPARPVLMLLAGVERWFRELLPVTAGQLAVFVNDSAVHETPPPGRPVPAVGVDDMVRRLTAHE